MLGRLTLPGSATPFVGRAADVETVTSLLVRPEVRLLTLVGLAGVGKTRLALEAARRVAADFDDRGGFAPLADVRDADLVGAALLASVSGGDSGVRDPVGRVAEMLGSQPALLVLDNFEHVLGARGVVVSLCDACPGLTVLVTSRHPLDIQAERIVTVRPLELPGSSSAQDVQTVDAVAFLLHRLSALNISITDVLDLSDAVEICRRLDGLPLALELAAARARVLPLSAIRDGLARRLDLLTRGPGDLPDRQRTMRDAIAWSYELLEPRSRAVLRALGLCVGGFTLPAATALAPDLGFGDVDLLDVLDELVTHSLVDPVENGRFRMLEVVREFAREELIRSGELESTIDRHTEYFLSYAEQASGHYAGRDQLPWLDRMHADAANVTAAVRHCVERSQTEQALRLCMAMRFVWYVRGPLREGQAFFAAALALHGGPDRLRVQAAVEAAALARHAGELDVAERLATDAADGARQLADPDLVATALLQVGFVQHLAGKYDAARVSLEECLAIRHDADDSLGVARALHHLGLVAYYGDGNTALAWETQVRCLELFRAVENQRHVATVLIAMAEIARARGDLPRATDLTVQALHAVTELQDGPLLAYALYTAAALAADLDRPSVAMRVLGAAEATQRTCAAPPWPAVLEASRQWQSHLAAQIGRPRAERLRAEGADLDASQVVTLLSAPKDDDGSPLTAREREIAVLVASGMRNGDIAARLVISRRTVDGHVARILGKLNFTSRSQIAAWVAADQSAPRHG